ncbi:hypothetical protein A2U01_0041783 [Trifolium medium]|uniref:Uncharacterized protein n=1 Tax=Trifolium medium TaxID=97028 RepID=A0A392Q8I0_9FABA|nr:hypothetical protein [Trifolium medium]
MTRKDMIAALEANCKELDEKKLQFECIIHALRLEEAAVEAANAEVGKDQADDAENDNASDDYVVVDSEDEDEDSDTSGSASV